MLISVFVHFKIFARLCETLRHFITYFLLLLKHCLKKKKVLLGLIRIDKMDH